MAKHPDLSGAYDLKTDEDHRTLYGEWAATYDTDFAERRGYTLHMRVADSFARLARPTDVPVLDIGAGTGLIADVLPPDVDVAIDALDLSPEMLDIARGKGRYRDYFAVDLAGHAASARGTYGAILSSGSFTIGHLGSDALRDAFQLLQPGGLYVLSINAAHFAEDGFDAAFASLEDVVTAPQLQSVRIYDSATGDGHDMDTAFIATGRKLSQ